MTSVISRIMIAPVLFSTLLGAAEIKKENIFHNQGHSITHDKRGFKVNGQRVSDVDLSGDLRGVNKDGLKKLFARGKALQVSRIGNDYRINSIERLKAGGPGFGAFMYWATKTVCYGIVGGGFLAGGAAVTAVATPVVAAATAPLLGASTAAAVGGTTGLAVGGAVGTVGAFTVPSTIAVGAGTTVASIVGTVAPIGAVATVVAADAGLATAAIVGTSQVASATIATGGLIGAIEGFSLFVGGVCGMAPTP